MTASPLLGTVDHATGAVLEHTRIPRDPVQDGAGWHVHLDHLAAHLNGTDGAADGCDDDFLAAYRVLEPRYAAAATG